MKHSNFILQKTYGNTEKDLIDFILICPHTSNGKDFLEKYPDIYDVIPSSKELLHTYLEIEKDTGAHEVIHNSAKHLEQITHGNAKIVTLECNVPRGLIDGNRRSAKSIRHVFSFQNYPKLFAQFEEIYKNMIAGFKEVFQKLNKEGLYVDVHTMAPFSPSGMPNASIGGVVETPDTLKQYCDIYSKKQYRGDKRPNCISVSYPGEEEFSHPILTKNFMEEAEKNKIPFTKNDPYSQYPVTMSSWYMENYPGIQIDIPKDQLSQLQGDDEKFDLANIQLCEQKIDIYGQTIAHALLHTSSM